MNKIGVGSDFVEIEIPIDPIDVEKSLKIFKSLNFTEVQESFQKRHNFEYKDVELAVKYSNDWGYHVELEILLTDRSQLSDATRKIRTTAEELGLRIMSDEELKDFTKKIDAEHRKKDIPTT